MKLSDFENHIENKILQRGHDYYRSGAVLSITEEGNNTYKAVVEGTDNYLVTVTLGNKDEILFSECDCPYDLGPECKHEVAVYYALRKLKNEKQPASTVINLREYTKKKDSTKSESAESHFHRILSALSKEELVTLLVSLSIDYPDIGNRLELKYSSDSEEQEIKNCIALIRTYVNENSDRYGYISYEDAYEATEGTRLVMERAEEAIERGQYIRAVNLYICVARVMVPLLNHTDDSDGYMSGAIQEAILRLSNITEYDMPQKDVANIFDKLLREAARKYFNDWSDWRLELLQTCAYLSSTRAMRKRLEKELESITEKSTDIWGLNYYTEKIAEVHYSLILRFDGQDKAEEYLESNLNYTGFRARAIERALSEKNYSRSEKLAVEGEAKDSDFPGLVNKWKKYRYGTYAHSGQLHKQRQLALEFVYKGDFEFYKLLKETYSQGEWLTVYPGIISALEEKRGYISNYTDILIEENALDKLLAYIKANPSTIIQYYKHLLPGYKEEVFQIFLIFINVEAKNASSRDGYRQVCKHIKLLGKAGGLEQAREVIVSLISAYPRRPALKDELLKVKL